jgi:hypothetical protein
MKRKLKKDRLSKDQKELSMKDPFKIMMNKPPQTTNQKFLVALTRKIKESSIRGLERSYKSTQ